MRFPALGRTNILLDATVYARTRANEEVQYAGTLSYLVATVIRSYRDRLGVDLSGEPLELRCHVAEPERRQEKFWDMRLLVSRQATV